MGPSGGPPVSVRWRPHSVVCGQPRIIAASRSHSGQIVMAPEAEMRPRAASSRMAAETPGAIP
jgi:hypothetical protein